MTHWLPSVTTLMIMTATALLCECDVCDHPILSVTCHYWV